MRSVPTKFLGLWNKWPREKLRKLYENKRTGFCVEALSASEKFRNWRVEPLSILSI